MANKRPPSYYKYKKGHPTVSVVLTKDLKEALNSYRENLSYGQAIRKLLTLTVEPYQYGYDKGYKTGYDDGVKKCIDKCIEKFLTTHDEYKDRTIKGQLAGYIYSVDKVKLIRG